MATETLPYILTSESEVERRFSVQGSDLRVDDLAGAELASFWEEVTSEASDIIFQYADQYEPSSLFDNRWVRSRATWIACSLLSERRGNAGQFATQYARIIAELEMVASGQITIPRALFRGRNAPSLSNLVVDDRSGSPLRVERATSVGREDTDESVYLNEWGYNYFY